MRANFPMRPNSLAVVPFGGTTRRGRTSDFPSKSRLSVVVRRLSSGAPLRYTLSAPKAADSSLRIRLVARWTGQETCCAMKTVRIAAAQTVEFREDVEAALNCVADV